MQVAAPLSPDRREGGFSLIEILAAAALLGGVMIGILTMFVYGGQSVNAGKMMTKAISISTDIQEQFRTISFRQAFLLLEDAGDATEDTHYCWDSRGEGADGMPCDPFNEPDAADLAAILEDWRLQVEGGDRDGDGDVDEHEKGLPLGSITVTVRGLAELGDNPAEATLGTAYVLQVVGTVRWKERSRARSVVFETLKV